MNPTDEENIILNNDMVNNPIEIKEIIEALLHKLYVFYEEVEVANDLQGNGPKFVIKSEESGILIGYRGEHLKALNHIVRRIVVKKSGLAKFSIDINNYQEENLQKIKNAALGLAQEVIKSGQSLEMEPMSSYERMIVHSLFTPDSQVATESIGEKNQRRVVIKPKTRD